MGLTESSTRPEGEVEVSEEQPSWSEKGLESRRGRSDRKLAINACKKRGFETCIWIGLTSRPNIHNVATKELSVQRGNDVINREPNTQHGLPHSYYPKRGDRDYTLANSQNLCPVFIQEKLASALRATCLQHRSLPSRRLNLDPRFRHPHRDIKLGLQEDPIANRLLDRSGLSPSFPGWKQTMKLNVERYSDQRA
jgi:hypothetical protein